jgi:vacuolar-type H+-ATPase catalytic subunit A/Vma1
MSSGSERLARTIAHLVQMTERLTEVLQRYRASSIELGTRVDRGERLEEIFPAIEGPARPREVTEVLAEFEAARHQVRLAMLELGGEQGITIAEMGRQLGLSRQLASRLAAESRETQK